MALVETLTPLALGIVGWFAAKFLADPYRRFFTLKGDIARQLVIFGNVRTDLREGDGALPEPTDEAFALRPDEQARLSLARDTFRDLAAQMAGFSESERLTVWALKAQGYDADRIARSLLAVSNSLPVYGKQRAAAAAEIRQTLKLKMP